MSKKKKFGIPHLLVLLSLSITIVGFGGLISTCVSVSEINYKKEEENQFAMFGYYDSNIHTLKNDEKSKTTDFPFFPLWVAFLLFGSSFGIFTCITAKWSNYDWDWSKQ